MQNTKKLFFTYMFLNLCFFVFVVFFIYQLVVISTDEIYKPVVFYSNSSTECVKVVYYNGRETSCEELPEKYKTIWVK